MSQLPLTWSSALLGDLIELNPKNSCDDDVEVGFVPMPCLGTRYLEKLSYEPRQWRDVKRGYTHFANGDVLLAKITPCFENGKAGIAQGLPNGIGAGSTEYFVCRPRSTIIDARYLLALFKTEKFIKKGTVQMTGSVGHKRVPKSYVTDTSIPLAPFAEQQRIADKLDAVLRRVNACRERLNRTTQMVKDFRRSVLRFPGAPEHALGQLGQVSGGLTKNGKRGTLPIVRPYLRVANVYSNELRLDEVAEIGMTSAEWEKTRLAPGDLLIVEGNGSIDQIGRLALWGGEIEECSHQNHLIRWRAGPDILPKYILYYLMSATGRQKIVQIASSTTGLHTLSVSKVAGLKIPVPSMAE